MRGPCTFRSALLLGSSRPCPFLPRGLGIAAPTRVVRGACRGRLVLQPMISSRCPNGFLLWTGSGDRPSVKQRGGLREKDRQRNGRRQHQETACARNGHRPVARPPLPNCKKAGGFYNFGFANAASRARRWTTAEE
jgi:hypothetical protein